MSEVKEIGTLVVVVGKARNLVNKSRFGKQDPFCTVTLLEDKQRTKSIKRGGQHPEWDEELRFTIYEDTDDLLACARSDSSDGPSTTPSISSISSKDAPGVVTSQSIASKSRKGPMTKKGGKSMRVACYADDAKEPELIGESVVHIDECLRQGEVDEWYEFLYKEKYSGEVYLELTFFSNNAPPVKRNVPRPPVTLNSSASTSSQLSASGSVSGMSLYIPPYAKPPVAIAPGAQQALPLHASSSFADLGVPPHARAHTPQPGQPSYPPSLPNSSSQQTIIPPHRSSFSIDAISRPLSSLSLDTSQSRPLPPLSSVPSNPVNQAWLAHAHRHSLGGPSDAPWGALMPPSRSPLAPGPHPRPSSTNDAVTWEQTQRMEVERRQAAATPVPRPLSGIGHQHDPYQHNADPSNYYPQPSSVPSSLQPAGGPPPTHHHSTSGSYSNSSLVPSSAPTPVPHSNSAPPMSPTTGHYGLPASSFAGIAQALVDPQRPPQTHPTYGLEPYRGGYQQPTPPHHDDTSQTDYGGTPTRMNGHMSHRLSLPQADYGPSLSIPNPVQPQSPSQPPAQQSGYQPHPDQGYGQDPRPPLHQPTDSGGYVPWYQQTQPTVQPVQHSQSPHPPSGSSPKYSSSAPPVANRRPIPQPPMPSRPSVGYYPSDELYVQQQQLPSQQADQWSQSQSNGFPTHNSGSYDSGYGQLPPQPFSSANQHGHPPRHSFSSPALPPRAPDGWNPSGPPDAYGRAPSPAPTPYGRAPSPQPYGRVGSPQPYGRAASPQPYGRSPSPAPPQPYYPPQQSYSSQPPYPPPRAPSPQPPHQASGTPTQLAPPSQTPLPHQPSRSPSPSPVSGPKQDWKSYMSALSTTSSTTSSPAHHQSRASMGGGRSPSPQPPPKEWYTPPPNLPASIQPPEGWRSTLPAQQAGRHWRG